MEAIRYSIQAWQESYDRKWRFVIKKSIRVTFKSSKRTGWRNMGFMKTEHDGKRFDSRADALVCARNEKAALLTARTLAGSPSWSSKDQTV